MEKNIKDIFDSDLFDNIEHTIKSLSKIIFYLLLFCGGIILILGLTNIGHALSEGYTLKDIMSYTIEDYATALVYENDAKISGYIGKVSMKIGLCVAISSLSALPLYGFGVLLENIIAIKEELTKQNNLGNK